MTADMDSRLSIDVNGVNCKRNDAAKVSFFQI